jgi:uncharacterized protein YccT (UPF0319 family)
VNELPSFEVETPGNVTELAMRLTIKETRAAAIEQVCDVYAKTRNIKGTAEAFGISSRTLDRLIARVPDLAARMAAMRDQWSNGT